LQEAEEKAKLVKAMAAAKFAAAHKHRSHMAEKEQLLEDVAAARCEAAEASAEAAEGKAAADVARGEAATASALAAKGKVSPESYTLNPLPSTLNSKP